MLSKHPFFSIIVPCCDIEPYAKECVMSIVNQSYQDWECILSIETSKDRTEDVLRELTANDARFHIITAPRSGSPSTPRNRGCDIALGEYIIFLDGDDYLADNALQRLHDKIDAHPDADLYPCTMLVRNEITGKDEKSRDNYPVDFNGELTGKEATLMVYMHQRYPSPMVPLTIYRRQYLVDMKLRCIDGLKKEDNEFAPRALYLARRVFPLHEAFYIYRIRKNSIMTTQKDAGQFIGAYAIILNSLLEFHARISQETGFDKRISQLWSRHWLTWVFYYWFSPRAITKVPRQRRMEHLKNLFANSFSNFDKLACSATLARRIACKFVKLSVKHPSMAWISDLFFLCFYYPLVAVRDFLHK